MEHDDMDQEQIVDEEGFQEENTSEAATESDEIAGVIENPLFEPEDSGKVSVEKFSVGDIGEDDLDFEPDIDETDKPPSWTDNVSSPKKVKDDGNGEDDDLDQIKVEEEEILVCDLCPKQCYGHKELSRHKKQAHLDTKEYTCEECGDSVKGARAFYSHRRRHKKFQCPKCEKHLVIGFKAAHIKKCQGVKDKIKRCEHEGCDYTTERLSNLKSHMVSHRKLFCDVEGCGREFHGKKKLDAHKRKEHRPVFAPQVCPKQGPKKPKTHGCDWCGFETRITTNLKSHLKSCAAKKMAEGVGPKEQISKEDLGLLYSLTNKCSMTEFNIILDFFMKKFGKHYFEQGAKSAVSEYANSLDYLHDSEEMTFQVHLKILCSF